MKYLKSITKEGLLAFLIISTSAIFSQNWQQKIHLSTSDKNANDYFGGSVSFFGDYAIVGAIHEDEDSSGSNTLNSAGSAYIFENISGTWKEVQKIVASDRGIDDQFGYSVSIFGDYAIVGVPSESEDTNGSNTLNTAGSAYIFKNNSGTWKEVQKIVASDREAGDNFGHSVSIFGDYAVVGAHFETSDASGGNSLVEAGSIYIYKNNEGEWEQVQKIVALNRERGDNFGYSVSISGDHIITGAYGRSGVGAVFIFKNTFGTWDQVQEIINPSWGNFGESVSIDKDYAIVGAPDRNTVYLINNNIGTWKLVQEITTLQGSTYFGASVSICGDYAVVGAPTENYQILGESGEWAGAAYIYKINNDTLKEVQKIVASNILAGDTFGQAVSISEDYIFVGARKDSDSILWNPGSIYIFSNSDVISVENEVSLPQEFKLSSNYPNPFNPTTIINYTIPNVGNENFHYVQLKVYDVLGKEIISLVNKEQYSGNYEVKFYASNLPSGLYFYRLQVYAPGRVVEYSETKKMILLR